MIFCSLTGYHIDRVDLPGVDYVLSFWIISFLFTAFAMGGIANAINIIDGVNGLSSGTSIIILSGFAIVAWQSGDIAVLGACLIAIAALAGFFLLNFPGGFLFMGDAGAYAAGFILAAIAVALPARNAEISPIIGLLALAYPVTETGVSVQRRMSRKGNSPGDPDRLHPHSLIYRSRARVLAKAFGVPNLRNGTAGLMVLALPVLSAALTVMFSKSSALIWVGIIIVVMAYLVIYRKVALLTPLLRIQRKPQEGLKGTS